MSKVKDVLENLREKIQIHNPRIVNLLSEFYATALLLFFGIGVVCQFVLSHEKLNTWINVNVGWGFALGLCVLLTSKTSGGHMNPAVSLLMVTLKRLSWTDFFLYCIVQTLGAFVGSALAYVVYLDKIAEYSHGLKLVSGANATAGLFTSFPGAHLSNCGAFIDQVAGTAVLTTCVAGIIDKRNGVPGWVHPILFGVTLITIGNSFGMNLGYPINPARDLGPRIFAYLIGYGGEVFSFHNYYFWIPVIAPLIGGLIGAWTYILLVGSHIPDPDKHVVAEKDEELQALG
uniref:Aquaporin-9 n=1 Tax=Panagrellus redivivus TaxID=6233 RepID=A0A7E4VK95_PANRE